MLQSVLNHWESSGNDHTLILIFLKLKGASIHIDLISGTDAIKPVLRVLLEKRLLTLVSVSLSLKDVVHVASFVFNLGSCLLRLSVLEASVLNIVNFNLQLRLLAKSIRIRLIDLRSKRSTFAVVASCTLLFFFLLIFWLLL